MTDQIHSCSYFCDRPACIKAQRDELRNRLAEAPRWVSVPVELTREMLSAADYEAIGCGIDEFCIGRMYAAMIAAAPKPAPAQSHIHTRPNEKETKS